jgi:hypothetical protein
MNLGDADNGRLSMIRVVKENGEMLRTFALA